MPTDLTGKLLGPFYVEKRLGSGAMGTVYRAIHKKNGKSAAIKVMSAPGDNPNPTLAARFEREIKLLKQFHHPHIVRVFGADEIDGIRFYAMELVDGRSLQEILDHSGKLSFQRASSYVIQLCEALQEIHGIGVIHRDLKPANIMISGDHQLKLTDFGIAKDLSAAHATQLTQAETTVGTVAYMSPEQLAGRDLTRRSDLYSLGIVIYRMVTGRLPFHGETMFDYMNARMADKYPLPTEIDQNLPFELDDLIKDLLAKDPKDRPLDAYVVMQRLLDINKKAKEGTLQKTRPKTAEHNIETVDIPKNKMSTVIKTMTGVFSRTKPGKRVVLPEDRPPFFESPPFLVGCLAAVVAFATYMFWPPSHDALFARGMALAESNKRDDMKAAMDKYFTPLLKRFPDSERRAEIDAIQEKIDIELCRGKAKLAKLRGADEDASEAERKFIEAQYIAATLGDRATANKKFGALIEFCKGKKEFRGWMALARERIEKADVLETDESRKAAKRNAIEKAIASAKEQLADQKIVEAVTSLGAVRTLYQGDEEVKDLLDQVNSLLENRK